MYFHSGKKKIECLQIDNFIIYFYYYIYFMQNVFLLTHWNDYQGLGFKTHLNQICLTKCPMYIYFHMRPLLMQSHYIKPILSLMQLNVLHSLRVAPPSGGMERLQSPLKNDEEPGTSEGCGLKIPWLHLFMNGFIRLDSRVDRKGTERETWCVTWQQTGTPCDGVAFGVTTQTQHHLLDNVSVWPLPSCFLTS